MSTDDLDAAYLLEQQLEEEKAKTKDVTAGAEPKQTKSSRASRNKYIDDTADESGGENASELGDDKDDDDDADIRDFVDDEPHPTDEIPSEDERALHQRLTRHHGMHSIIYNVLEFCLFLISCLCYSFVCL